MAPAWPSISSEPSSGSPKPSQSRVQLPSCWPGRWLGLLGGSLIPGPMTLLRVGVAWIRPVRDTTSRVISTHETPSRGSIYRALWGMSGQIKAIWSSIKAPLRRKTWASDRILREGMSHNGAALRSIDALLQGMALLTPKGSKYQMVACSGLLCFYIGTWAKFTLIVCLNPLCKWL